MENSVSTIRPVIYLGAYALVWSCALILLRVFEGFDPSEALAALVIFGIFFPALAMLVTSRTQALQYVVRRPRTEAAALLMYLAVIGWVLVIGFDRLARLSTEPWHSVVVVGIKLAVFVVVPAAMIKALGHYKIADLAPVSFGWRQLRPAIWMSIAGLLMQSVLGRGLSDIRQAHLPMWALTTAVPLSFGWLIVEVGVVEEFFFRVLLQERLAIMLRSPWGGLVASAVFFGLVHAPGFYLRTTATQETLGAHPSLLMAAGYSIVLTSLAGLFLGVLWIRTKNLVVLAIVHAATDLLPNLVPLTKVFHLAR